MSGFMWPDEPRDDGGPWHAPGPECPACGGPMQCGARCCGDEACMRHVDGRWDEDDEPLGEEPMAAA